MLVVSNTLGAVAMILGGLLNVYFWIIVIAAVITWVQPNPYNVFVRTLRALTEPVFYRIRRWMPFTYTKGMDFSPIVALIIIELLNHIVVKSMMQYAAQMH